MRGAIDAGGRHSPNAVRIAASTATTTSVRRKVAKSDGTPSTPTLAKIAVSAAKAAESRAQKAQAESTGLIGPAWSLADQRRLRALPPAAAARARRLVGGGLARRLRLGRRFGRRLRRLGLGLHGGDIGSGSEAAAAPSASAIDWPAPRPCPRPPRRRRARDRRGSAAPPLRLRPRRPRSARLRRRAARSGRGVRAATGGGARRFARPPSSPASGAACWKSPPISATRSRPSSVGCGASATEGSPGPRSPRRRLPAAAAAFGVLAFGLGPGVSLASPRSVLGLGGLDLLFDALLGFGLGRLFDREFVVGDRRHSPAAARLRARRARRARARRAQAGG